MYIEKTEIVAALQARGLHVRAGWVERALPRLVDTRKNNSLLQMLGIDLAAMSPVDPPPSVAVADIPGDPTRAPDSPITGQ